jgi:hypothetical protein
MLAAVASENRKLKGSTSSLSSRQRINLREWLTELEKSKEWRVISVDRKGQNQSTVKHQSRVEISSVDSEEAAGQKSQKVKLMCCKIVKYSEKTYPTATLSTTNPTWFELGLSLGLRGGKPTTNHLSYATAQA